MDPLIARKIARTANLDASMIFLTKESAAGYCAASSGDRRDRWKGPVTPGLSRPEGDVWCSTMIRTIVGLSCR
jgi:hypothetical protein